MGSFLDKEGVLTGLHLFLLATGLITLLSALNT